MSPDTPADAVPAAAPPEIAIPPSVVSVQFDPSGPSARWKLSEAVLPPAYAAPGNAKANGGTSRAQQTSIRSSQRFRFFVVTCVMSSVQPSGVLAYAEVTASR